MLDMLRTFFRNIREVPMKVEAKDVGRVDVDPALDLFLDHLRLREADYSGRELLSFGAYGCRFERCNFNNLRADSVSFGSGMELTEYIDCTFDGLRFSHSIGNVARFVRCSFRDIKVRKWTCFEAEFIDCTFTGRLQTCIFNGTVSEEDRPWVGRERNEFRGNDFSGAELVDVAFRTGIDLDQQRLPTGPDYLYVPDAAAAIERAQRGLADWMPDTEFQRLAQVIVTVQASAVADG
jgi:uncharacterized protein YjbI with pentapeptide repeats